MNLSLKVHFSGLSASLRSGA